MLNSLCSLLHAMCVFRYKMFPNWLKIQSFCNIFYDLCQFMFQEVVTLRPNVNKCMQQLNIMDKVSD